MFVTNKQIWVKFNTQTTENLCIGYFLFLYYNRVGQLPNFTYQGREVELAGLQL